VDDSPVERQNKGIITIYQEFNLLPNMTVAENMFLGREPRKRNLIVDEKAVNQEAQVILDYLQLNVAPTTPVARLSVAQQQMVEIARALTLNARLIIMDEPSAALSDSEVESLHRVVRELKNREHYLRYPPSARSFPALRPLHRFPGRPFHRHRRGGGDQRRTADPPDGRARRGL
jgi:inositol transport system ATP-binding protein